MAGVGGIVKGVGHMLSKNSPHILTAIGTGGVLASIFATAKASPKASRKIKQREVELGRKLTVLEMIDLCWKDFVIVALTGGVSVASIIGADYVNTKRIGAIAALLALSENTLNEYKDKILEKLGPKKADEIKEAIQLEELKEYDPGKVQILPKLGMGTILCYDKMSGRYFISDMEHIRKTLAAFNSDFLEGGHYMSLNNFYEYLGLDTIGNWGNELGWSIRNGLVTCDLDTRRMADDTPIIYMDLQDVENVYLS